MLTPLIFDDEAEFQKTITRASDGRRVRGFRVTFGAHYLDNEFLANAAEAKTEYEKGEIDGVLCYAVPLPSATPDQFVAYVKWAFGPTPPPWLMGVYQDWERWGGTSYAISGDHSGWANRAYGLLAHYMGSWTASGFYGNKGDLDELIPHRDPRGWVIEANYCSDLNFHAVQGQIGQQYCDGQTKWGLPVVNGHALPHSVNGVNCDHNAIDPSRFPTGAKLRAYMRPSVPAHAPAPTPAAPRYQFRASASHENALASAAGAYAAEILDDGRFEIRSNDGNHVRYL